jgi:beta-N-acetylhexosaminidase
LGEERRRVLADLVCVKGWEGTEVTPQIRTLIEDHHLGAILLTTKNLKSKLNSSLPFHALAF